jgi:SAM-dependent methyltransferase
MYDFITQLLPPSLRADIATALSSHPGISMDRTRQYYIERAGEYARSALALTPARAWDLFCNALSPQARILDLGCGPGRDVLEFTNRGFEVIGVDASSAMVEIARRHANADIRVADFSRLDFTRGSFDGVWAMASLLHVPRSDVGQVLDDVRRLLAADGVLFTAMRDGSGPEVDAAGRFFERYWMGDWAQIVTDAGFTIVTNYATESGDRPWHVTLARCR